MPERAVAKPAEAAGLSLVSRQGDRGERDADRAADELLRVAGHDDAEPHALKAAAGRLLGFDFASVRIHRDADAAHAAERLKARAFTVGSDIAFGARQFAPQTAEGRWLLFHELAHVAQQARGLADARVQRKPVAGDTEQLHGDLEAQYAKEHGGVAPAGGAHGEEYSGWLMQSTYDAAVKLLQSKDPVLFGYLAQGRVGGSVSVRSFAVPVQGAGAGKPTSAEFRFVLKVIHGTRRAGSAAEFERTLPVAESKPPTATIVLSMPMHFNTRTGPNATAELAEALYHEGVHMLMAMDRVIEDFMPGSAKLQSGKLVSFQAMKAKISSDRVFVTLKVDLETTIGGILVGTGMPHTQAATEAREMAGRIMDGILEERFAIDEQRRQHPGRPVQTVTNALIAQEYLPNELLNEMIVLKDPAAQARLIQETKAVLDLVPQP